jgi:hypothetical protein
MTNDCRMSDARKYLIPETVNELCNAYLLWGKACRQFMVQRARREESANQRGVFGVSRPSGVPSKGLVECGLIKPPR